MKKCLLIFCLLLALPVHASAENRVFKVGGTSMLPTLKPGDRVTVDTSYYQTHPFECGHLVAIKFSTRKRPMVKRIIALSGDRVKINNGRIIISGKAPDGSGCNRTRDIAPGSGKILAIQLKRYDNRVPAKTLIVSGDNRENTFDSLDYGIISKNQIIGRVLPDSSSRR